MGRVIELRGYKDNGETIGLPSGQDNIWEVNSAQQLLSFIEKTQGNCSLAINLPRNELAKAIPQLIELLHKGNPSVQKHVLEVLGNMEVPEVVPHIIPFCFQPDLYLKAQAVKSLELLKQPTAILPLKELLGDENQQIRKNVSSALKKLIDDDFLLMLVAHEESKPGLSSIGTFFELISLFSPQELEKFSSYTIKALFEFFQRNEEKNRELEEQLLKKQWEAEAVAGNLFQQKKGLTKSYSDSRLELEVFRRSFLSQTQARNLLPEVTSDQEEALDQLRSEHEDLKQAREDAKFEISRLLAKIEELKEQIDEAPETKTEDGISAESSPVEQFDPGIFALNEDILDDLFIQDPSHAQVTPSSEQVFSEVILLAEQNPSSAEYLRSLLSHNGFSNLRIFRDGRLATEEINQHHSELSLILAAQRIPNLDGLEFLNRIRAFEKEQGLNGCPVVVITDEINTYKLNQLLEAGATAVFPRLFIPDELVESIVKHSGVIEVVDDSTPKQNLLEITKIYLARFRKQYQKKISLAIKHSKDLRSFPTHEEGFETLFKNLIEFCVVSAPDNSKVILRFRPAAEQGKKSDLIIAASFEQPEELIFKDLEDKFNEGDVFEGGEIVWNEKKNTVEVTLPFQSKDGTSQGKAEEILPDGLDDEDVFELLDELEEEGTDIQNIIGKIEELCTKEPFRLFSVMDFLHDAHFERAHREILEMLQRLDRVDIIPYLIRRFQQLHKEYKLWTLSFIAEKDVKAGLYFIISVLRDQDEEIRHRALAVLLEHFDASFLQLLMHSFIRTFRLPRTLSHSEILGRLPAKERSAFFQILLFNEDFEQSAPFLFGYLEFAAPFEQESIYIALAAQKSLQYLNEEQVETLKVHFEHQQVLQRFPNITLSLLLSASGDLLEWIMGHIKSIYWTEVFKPRFIEDVKSGWEAMGPYIQEGVQEILEHIVQAEELLFTEQLDEDQKKEIYRMFHMSKGVALSLDLEILVALYHYIESAWSELTPHVDEESDEIESFRKNFKCLLDVTQKAAQIINLVNQDSSFLLEKKPLNSIFPRLEHLFNKLIMMLKKEINLVLLEEKLFYFDPAVLSSFNEILIQLIKNSVDHGIEAAEERENLGKPRS
ncbi:MAG: HEAT repeat domain-containing protein, partial [SAR324 cluster bacterium]|nr:HEAT repeat domain-containing protein [SAR324 cluster bacterium]